MARILDRFSRSTLSPLGGSVLVLLLGAATTLASVVGMPFSPPGTNGVVHAALPGPVTTTDFSGVQLSAELSQGKILQGHSHPLYLKLSVKAPESEKRGTSRLPVDMVVVLDRSGSMSDPAKLPYARTAIQDLLQRLNSEDRFALVTFEDVAEVIQYPIAATPENKSRISEVVARIQTAGSTNMSGGLESALSILNQSDGVKRVRKVLLLSDGEANVGVSDATGLAHIANRFIPQEAILSTIGMGLGFNEHIMATLADHGQGNFGYLETLEKLAALLSKELEDSRALLAQSSRIEIELGEGVSISDASGYPINKIAGTNRVSIPTGQLLYGGSRAITLALNVPTSALGRRHLGTVKFSFAGNGAEHNIQVPADVMQVAIIQPELRDEMLASVNKDLMKTTWENYRIGRLQSSINESLRSGDKDSAGKALEQYNRERREAEAAYGMPLSAPKAEAALGELDTAVADAFTGTAEEQKVKQNRAAKKAYSEGLQLQRSTP